MSTDQTAPPIREPQAPAANLTDAAARVAVITLDARNRVTHFNRGAQKILAISPLEVTGRLISDFVDND